MTARGMGAYGSVDDAMGFLRELRQLRNEAGLGPAELAARAHYPHHVIEAAEAGPSIPDLPVLSAYVRGCGGGLAEWEERWRFLTGTPAAAPGLPARPVGSSSLAAAGARAAFQAPAVDPDDRHRILAAMAHAASIPARVRAPGRPAQLMPAAQGTPRAQATRPPAVAHAGPAPVQSPATGTMPGVLTPHLGRGDQEATAPAATPPSADSTALAAIQPSTVPAVAAVAPLVRRLAAISRAAIAVTATAVALAVTAIITLLLRKG